MSIGENIKRIAEQKNLSLYRVAKNAGISNSYLCDLTKNKSKNPSIRILKKLASALDVTVDEIMA